MRHVSGTFLASVIFVSHSIAAQTVFIGGSRLENPTPYTVNTSTGAATAFGTSVGQMEGLSFDTTRNRIVATQRNNNQIKTIDPISGTVGTLTLSASTSLEGLAYDRNRDLLWATEQTTGNLYRINPATGQTTLATPIPLGGGVAHPGGLGYDPIADVLYGVDDNRLYSINTTTFAVAPIGPAGFGVGFTDVDAMEFDTQTGLLYIINDLGGGPLPLLQQFASLNPATGLATVIGSTGLQEQFGQGMAIIAPEPATMAILAPAMMARRRRR